MKARALLLIWLAVGWAVRPALGTTLVRLSLEQLSQAASAVVRGRVLSQESRWNAEHTRIITLTTVVVEQSLKGPSPSTVLIEQPGGAVGNIHVRVAGAVQFHPQTEYVLFLEPAVESSRYRVVGMIQGAFKIYREQSKHQDRVILPLGALSAGAVTTEPGGSTPGPTLAEFQQRITTALRAPLSIPRGTSIPLSIQSAESRGTGRRRVLGRITADIFPNAGVVIPAGSAIEGTATRVGESWKIHWDEVDLRGIRVPISATSEAPASGSLAGRALVVNVR